MHVTGVFDPCSCQIRSPNLITVPCLAWLCLVARLLSWLCGSFQTGRFAALNMIQEWEYAHNATFLRDVSVCFSVPPFGGVCFSVPPFVSVCFSVPPFGGRPFRCALRLLQCAPFWGRPFRCALRLGASLSLCTPFASTTTNGCMC